MRWNFRAVVLCVGLAQGGVASQILQDSILMHSVSANAQRDFRLNQRTDSLAYDSDVWVNLIVGNAALGSASQNLFGFASGIDTTIARHLLVGIGLGYVRGTNDVRTPVYNSTHQLFGSLYARLFSTHNELDIAVHGNIMHKEIIDSVRSLSTDARAYALGGKASYGYVFRFTHSFLKPIIAYNAYYANAPTSTQGLWYQSAELGLEWRIGMASGSYVYVQPSYEFVLHDGGIDPTQLAQDTLTLPRGFVNLLAGGQFAYKERLAFYYNVAYKRAIDARDSHDQSVGLSVFSVWGGVKFGF